MKNQIQNKIIKAKEASKDIALLSHQDRNKILKNLASLLRKNKKELIAANQKDAKLLSDADPKKDRLILNDARIENMANEIDTIVKMPDPIGEIFECRTNGDLKICKKRVPFGVIGIIYESRPNVTTDVAAICIKSGNAVVLKGGKEARESYVMIHKLIKEAFTKAGGNAEAVQFIDPLLKDAAKEIINAQGLIDLVIPRGSSNLINFVRDNATVPVIETGAGVCHIFVDESAKLNASAEIIFNAKTQRPSVCNAVDTALVHKKIAKNFLPKIAKLLQEKGVEIYADNESYAILKKVYPPSLLRRATAEHFACEFLSLKMSIKLVGSANEAIKFITHSSSKHSESILTENKKNAERFLNEIDAAVVYVNASTRFSDGAMFGLGSEIGISTDKLHARGPMGPNEMTTYKWEVRGNYTTRK